MTPIQRLVALMIERVKLLGLITAFYGPRAEMPGVPEVPAERL